MKNEFISDSLDNVGFLGIQKKIGDKMGINIRGSAFLLSSGEIISCAHVYNQIPRDERKSIFLGLKKLTKEKIHEYKNHEVKLVTKDDKRDIAVFRTSDDEVLEGRGFNRSALMKEEDIESVGLGTELQYIGFPFMNELLAMGLGITVVVNQCILASIKFSSKDNKIDFLLIDKWVNPGNSGSPVMLENRIVGVASGALNRTHKIGQASLTVPLGIGIVRTSNYILDLLSKNDKA